MLMIMMMDVDDNDDNEMKMMMMVMMVIIVMASPWWETSTCGQARRELALLKLIMVYVAEVQN